MFVKNGHNKKLLKNLVIEYNNKKNNKSIHKTTSKIDTIQVLKNLFWIPTISPKIEREFKKIGKDITSTSGKHFLQFLGQKNKPKLLIS